MQVTLVSPEFNGISNNARLNTVWNVFAQHCTNFPGTGVCCTNFPGTSVLFPGRKVNGIERNWTILSFSSGGKRDDLNAFLKVHT